MRRRRPILSPVDLREIYPEVGEYGVKIMIDPAVSPKLELQSVLMRDSDGKPMKFEYRRWGTKLNITFTIDESTPDGVSAIDVLMSHEGKDVKERFVYWTIK